MNAPALLIALTIVALIPTYAARAGTCSPTVTQALSLAEPLADDLFGRGVAVDGGAAIVGSPNGDGLEVPIVPETGIITMYHVDSTGTWSEDGLFANPRNTGYESFGDRVALSGEFAVTNARPRPSVGQLYGAVILYRFDGNMWAFADSLLPSDTTVVNYFGENFGIGGNKLAVWDDGTTGNDLVHMYTNNGLSWGFETTLANPDGDPQDKFGSSMAIDGDVLVVGSSEYGPGLGPGRGAIHIYRHDGSQWNFEQRVDSPNPFGGNRYGLQVAIDGTTIAVAAPNTHVTPNHNEGALYVVEFNGTSWENVARLIASDGEPGDQLGITFVDVDDGVVIAGAPSHGLNPLSSGAVYVFRRPETGWVDATEDAKLIPAVPGEGNSFGWSGGLHEGVALVGDPGNDESMNNAGLVTVHSLGCDVGTTAAPLVARRDVAALRAWPNPFRAGSGVRFAATEGSEPFVTVRDVRGARVRTLRGTTWDGLGDAGRPLPAGQYFLEVRSGASRATGRVVLLR